MSKLAEIRQIVLDIKNYLFSITEKTHIAIVPEKGSIIDSQREKLKEDAIKSIDSLCDSIIYKMELSSHKLATIKTFDWEIYHNFDYYSEIAKAKDGGDEKVIQKLHDGALCIACKDKNTMENFILTDIATFFSNISSVIDNISLILKDAFRLEIKGIVRISEIHDKLADTNLKEILSQHMGKDYSFGGMRKVRKSCEHYDVTKVFQYSEAASLGKRDLGAPYVNNNIVVFDTQEDGRIDIYCEFLHTKLIGFIKELKAALSKVAS